MQEKSGLLGHPPPSASGPAPATRWSRGFQLLFKTASLSVVAALLVGTVLLVGCPEETADDLFFALARRIDAPLPSHRTDTCPQPEPYRSSQDPASVPLDVLAERLSKAIQIDTSVGDNWPDPVDDPERWRAFGRFAAYLKDSFPLAHERLDLETVHEHGLLYTWTGSDSDLKPLLMMAHQDVVPVNPATARDWVHPPFSGYIDRENQTVWGRGSTDCKSWLISIMSTVEAMLERGFEPKRTILFSFGFDEESNGPQGAAYLSSRIEELWGKDSIAMLVDEGNPIVPASDPLAPGISVALPGVEEKGILDIEVTIETAGGHSSAPPAHTSIGLISRAVAAIEDSRDQLSAAHLVDNGAPLTFLQCIRDAPAFPADLRAALKDLDWATRSSVSSIAAISSVLPLQLLGLDGLVASGIGRLVDRGKDRRIRRAKERVVHALPQAFKTPFVTTTAADVIYGGVKLNALPESATVLVNHRIATSSGIAQLQQRYIEALKPLARSQGLSLEAFGSQIDLAHEGMTIGKITLKHFRPGFEPSPNTPLVGEEAAPWKLFSSIIRATWKDEHGSPVLVAPAMMQGNTDSRYFNNLTKHIFRFGPNTLQSDKTGLGAMTGVHTINEHFAIQGLGDAVRFYSTLFQAVGEAKL